jgi:5-methylcytosine-specific restriction protein A
MATFTVGAAYTRDQICDLLMVPEERRGGAWNRGYRDWAGEMFIFATLGVGTTSGFSYPNALQPDGSLMWTGVATSHSGQRQLQAILAGGRATHVFVRRSDRGPFVYLGSPGSVELLGDRPVRTRFHFGERSAARTPSAQSFSEGAPRDVVQSRRERDPGARQACLDHWKSACVVCGVDTPWNHVHHLFPIAEGERDVNPITDLRPVCPSCHAMIHWFRPMLTIEEARDLWSSELSPGLIARDTSRL